MSDNDQNGPDRPRGSPWGIKPGNQVPPAGKRGGRSPFGPRPPDIEELLRRALDYLRGVISGGSARGGYSTIALVALAIWLASGLYIVSPDEQGVVLRFGKFVGRTAPGINYRLPWPIDSVYTPKVTRENQINIGYRTLEQGANANSASDIAAESLMLTGDENIVDVNFTVFWLIRDAEAFLFNVENPSGDSDATIKSVAESAMREVVGRNQIERILTEDREPIQVQVRDLMQKTLDSYGAGVTVTRIQMQKVDPPSEVIAAYRDVQAARADQERKRNEAEAYANTVIPQARGQAARVLQQAEAYKQQQIAEATGESRRFLSVYAEYRKAPDVTRRRLYLETMSQVLAPMNKIVVDDAAKGVVPYFQLPPLAKSFQRTAPAASPADQSVVRPGAAQ